jgi:hypothetical protein
VLLVAVKPKGDINSSGFFLQPRLRHPLLCYSRARGWRGGCGQLTEERVALPPESDIGRSSRGHDALHSGPPNICVRPRVLLRPAEHSVPLPLEA